MVDRNLYPRGWQATQLEQDLASPEVIRYRRLPGTGPKAFGPRTYYDPETGRQVSEDYVVRHYRPALRNDQQAAYAEYQEREASYRATQASIRASVQQSFLLKKASDSGLPLNPRVGVNGAVTYSFPQSFIRANNAEFTRLYGELRYHQIIARTTGRITYNPNTGAPIMPPEREALLAPNGEYANTLVALGRRKPNEDFQVGMSPDSRGGYALNDYISTKVIPYYAGE